MTPRRSSRNGRIRHCEAIELKKRFRQWQFRVIRSLHSSGYRKQSVPHDVPKGCVGICVGEEQRRFVVPILYLNHPLFSEFLECSTDDQCENLSEGPLHIPCDVSEFETFQSKMMQLTKRSSNRHIL
ncbi:hypothetical protein KP509_35G043100 [Ceratopteris richardii]|uniref:Small auxin up regulated protein n=1 Tax=Ceratopteris richardii TaxID=49495 RepID=A0A8T2QG21_CERRI|nr:hypothetical protein KP509_35G043100 [Ceratopteris richardii]